MRGNMRLQKEYRFYRIEPAGEIKRRQFIRIRAKARRILPDGERMQIRQHKKAIVFILHRSPVSDRPEVIAYR